MARSNNGSSSNYLSGASGSQFGSGWGEHFTFGFWVRFPSLTIEYTLDRSGWSASASSEYGAGYEASKAIDGTAATGWVSSGNTPQYLIIDLGSAKTFDKVVVDPWSTYQVGQYEIYVSDDGSSWGSAIASGTWSGITRQTAEFTAVTKRYIKINVITTQGSSLAVVGEFYLQNTTTGLGADEESCLVMSNMIGGQIGSTSPGQGLGKLEFYNPSYAGGNPNTDSDITVPDDEWHHVAWRMSGSEAPYVWDKFLDGEKTVINGSFPSFLLTGGGGGKAYIFSGVDGDLPFYGEICEVFFLNDVLTDQEIAYLALGPRRLSSIDLGSRSLALEAYWKITGDDSPELDSSPDPHSLTVTGSLPKVDDPLFIILGSVCWGHDTGVEEDNIENFNTNWTGSNMAIAGIGDAERLILYMSGYGESPTWEYGARRIKILVDKYGITGSGSGTVKYKNGSSQANCEADSWHTYTVPFICSGWVKVRLEV